MQQETFKESLHMLLARLFSSFSSWLLSLVSHRRITLIIPLPPALKQPLKLINHKICEKSKNSLIGLDL